MSTDAQSLDAGTSMSVEFVVRIDTNRLTRDFASIDEAIARLGKLGNKKPFTAQAGVTIKPGTNAMSNQDNSSTLAYLQNTTDRIEIKAQEAMAEAMEMGAKLVKRDLRFAITEYGLYRYLKLKRGKSAGRDDRGDMIKAVTWNAQRTVRNVSKGSKTMMRKKTLIVGGTRKATVRGFFGWDEPEVYMVAQEKGFVLARAGTSRKKRSRAYVYKGKTSVEGAKSLGNSMIVVRNHLIKQLGK